MPREIITAQYGPGEQSLAVSLTWQPDTDVQLATLGPEGVPLEPTPSGNGWFLTLDRASLNRLIRALRRARDSAYGRDE